MKFSKKYKEIFIFILGYFPDADLFGKTDEEVVREYISDCLKSEISTQELEKVKIDFEHLVSEYEIYWKEIGEEANRYFKEPKHALKWLTMIKNELNNDSNYL